MKKIYSLLIITAVFTACKEDSGEGKSVEEVIDSKDPVEINAKKDKVLEDYDKASADLAQLEEALAELDTTKKLPIVTSFTLTPFEFKHFVNIQGDVATKQNIVISPEFQGTLNEVFVNEGDRVVKGQLLAKIDDGGLNQSLAQAKVQAGLAKTTYDRTKRLWDQNIGSEMQYLQAKSNHEASESVVSQMVAQLEKVNVRAPFSGIIDDVISEKGQVVSPQSKLFRIVNLSNMYVSAAVPENYIGKIDKGTNVIIETPSLGASQEAKVRQVGSFINPANRTYNIEVPVPNSEGRMKPNQIVNLKINDYTSLEALVIPDDIIQENAKGETFVYVLSESNSKGEATLSKVQIKTGYSYNNMIEVVEGLSAGQTLVKEGAKSMREGLVVKVKSLSIK